MDHKASTYHLYILFSETKDRFYIGSTNDVVSRVERHNTSRYGYTRTGRPWKLIYTEEYASRAEAMCREREIKRWKSAKAVRALVREKN